MSFHRNARIIFCIIIIPSGAVFLKSCSFCRSGDAARNTFCAVRFSGACGRITFDYFRSTFCSVTSLYRAVRIIFFIVIISGARFFIACPLFLRRRGRSQYFF